MIFTQDFRKLLVVCLKMLFRKTTRKRFVCLILAFLFIIGFNTYSYVRQYLKTEIAKNNIISENAFKVFFVRMRTQGNCLAFLNKHSMKLNELGSQLVMDAFIYQNNLFIQFQPDINGNTKIEATSNGARKLLCGLFKIDDQIQSFYIESDSQEDSVQIWNIYVDYNGIGLSPEMIKTRHTALLGDLSDITDMIKGSLGRSRAEVVYTVRDTLFREIHSAYRGKREDPNPYLSRVESIVPLNFLNILSHIASDNTTDIIDLAESVQYKEDSIIETERGYLEIPDPYKESLIYGDINVYPRYIPLYIPELLTQNWNWWLYYNIRMKEAFTDYLEKLQFMGSYLFSYEKLKILKEKVRIINEDIHANHMRFYMTDLTLGIAFPFMMSLFAFIHLKTELAFLLMFKNRIRELLFIFWMLPVMLMFFVKVGILSGYLLLVGPEGISMIQGIFLPLTICFIVASLVFYPMNRWCFNQLIGDNINLYALHKGR